MTDFEPIDLAGFRRGAVAEPPQPRAPSRLARMRAQAAALEKAGRT